MVPGEDPSASADSDPPFPRRPRGRRRLVHVGPGRDFRSRWRERMREDDAWPDRPSPSRAETRQRMQIVFQAPHAALIPAMSIGQSIVDPLLIHGLATEAEAKEAALGIMTEAGLSPAEQLYTKYPADLSGGQKQRAVIARAIILKPKLIVADEPVAMLDMSIRARILELMLELKEKYCLTYLFITHDLATAKFICDRIAIMYLGKFVEVGDAKAIYREPKHPYTTALLGAVPIPDPDRRRFKTLPSGEVPDAIYPPLGCRFHPRCPVSTPTCGWEARDVIDLLELRALQPDTAAIDEQNFGPISRLRAEGLQLRIPTGQRGIDRVRAHVEKLRGQAPPPMAGAVARTLVEGTDVLVEFQPSQDPGLRAVDGREVRCVLY